MKLMHTSDWHLRQLFHGYERHAEHQAFLDWLIGQLQERELRLSCIGQFEHSGVGR